MNHLDLSSLVFSLQLNATPLLPRLPPASPPNLTLLARLSTQQDQFPLSRIIYYIIHYSNPDGDLQHLLNHNTNFAEV